MYQKSINSRPANEAFAHLGAYSLSQIHPAKYLGLPLLQKTASDQASPNPMTANEQLDILKSNKAQNKEPEIIQIDDSDDDDDPVIEEEEPVEIIQIDDEDIVEEYIPNGIIGTDSYYCDTTTANIGLGVVSPNQTPQMLSVSNEIEIGMSFGIEAAISGSGLLDDSDIIEPTAGKVMAHFISEPRTGTQIIPTVPVPSTATGTVNIPDPEVSSIDMEFNDKSIPNKNTRKRKHNRSVEPEGQPEPQTLTPSTPAPSPSLNMVKTNGNEIKIKSTTLLTGGTITSYYQTTKRNGQPQTQSPQKPTPEVVQEDACEGEPLQKGKRKRKTLTSSSCPPPPKPICTFTYSGPISSPAKSKSPKIKRKGIKSGGEITKTPAKANAAIAKVPNKSMSKAKSASKTTLESPSTPPPGEFIKLNPDIIAIQSYPVIHLIESKTQPRILQQRPNTTAIGGLKNPVGHSRFVITNNQIYTVSQSQCETLETSETAVKSKRRRKQSFK